ncbi:hypothetical protein A0H76_1443 [Hepatospora eriocheir]|uniref:Uncharacterized protein n=1 Tax=Hepatospora eriocheir TaxID=1081669 RepID=A0A1X0Q5W3_9MICR|nr:hypothetical protein A0H76_1443 [Hepatospora eriocheir]
MFCIELPKSDDLFSILNSLGGDLVIFTFLNLSKESLKEKVLLVSNTLELVLFDACKSVLSSLHKSPLILSCDLLVEKISTLLFSIELSVVLF